MGRIWPTGPGSCQPLLQGDVSAPWLAVEVTGSAEAIEPGPGVCALKGLIIYTEPRQMCISTHRDPCLGIRQYHRYPFLCSLISVAYPLRARHCPGLWGHGDRAPALPWGPCSHYRLCEQGFWDIDPRAMSGSTWMRRWRTTARSGPPSHPRLLYPSL